MIRAEKRRRRTEKKRQSLKGSSQVVCSSGERMVPSCLQMVNRTQLFHLISTQPGKNLVDILCMQIRRRSRRCVCRPRNKVRLHQRKWAAAAAFYVAVAWRCCVARAACVCVTESNEVVAAGGGNAEGGRGEFIANSCGMKREERRMGWRERIAAGMATIHVGCPQSLGNFSPRTIS